MKLNKKFIYLVIEIDISDIFVGSLSGGNRYSYSFTTNCSQELFTPQYLNLTMDQIMAITNISLSNDYDFTSNGCEAEFPFFQLPL